ncbi:MAG TPA: hypothetical protein VHE35_03375 [Kofleriaceae bacterium]|nr:hypothetical protein [Kofleriaceae bacterium]
MHDAHPCASSTVDGTADPHLRASSRIDAIDADGATTSADPILCALLDAQARWLARRDAVGLRRRLLSLLMVIETTREPTA